MLQSLHLYTYDLVEDGKIIRHNLYKSHQLDKQTFADAIVKKYQNTFEEIEFVDLIEAIAFNKEILDVEFVGSGAYGFAFKFTMKNKERKL